MNVLKYSKITDPMVQASKPSIQETEAGGAEVEANLCYKRETLTKKENKNKKLGCANWYMPAL